MSESARDAILGRLDAGARPPEVPDGDFQVMAGRPGTVSERIERFRTAIEAANAEVHATTPAGWPAFLMARLNEWGIDRIAFGRESWAGRQLIGDRGEAANGLVPFEGAIEDFKETLFACDAGLTTTRGAIAETGSLILWSGPDEPRALSLVPPVHVALVRTGSIHATLHEAMTADRWRDGLPTNAVLVSGPSKTADIEQTLVYGVHGPRRLVVILLADVPGGDDGP